MSTKYLCIISGNAEAGLGILSLVGLSGAGSGVLIKRRRASKTPFLVPQATE